MADTFCDISMLNIDVSLHLKVGSKEVNSSYLRMMKREEYITILALPENFVVVQKQSGVVHDEGL